MRIISKINKNYSEVFIISFVLFFLETVYMKTVIFIHDYLNALLIISYALIGLGIGSIISHRIKKLSINSIFILKLIIIASIVLSFINFTYFAMNLFFSPVLLTPFAAGNIIITNYIKNDNAHKIYFFDLCGATLGVLLSIIIIPLIREENCFILIIIILSASILIHEYNIHIKSVSHILLAIGILLFFYSLDTDNFNFIKITKCRPGMDPLKIFCRPEKFDIQYSKGSNAQRIDAVTINEDSAKNIAERYIVNVFFDGYANDGIAPGDYTQYGYHNDPRIINEIVDSPHLLIIGASAEGIVKSAYSISGKITALEINKQIINLMNGPMFEYSRHAYGLIDDLHNIDARTFMESTKGKYDIITLMNIHLVLNSGYAGSPEFLHTYEAVNQYFEHVTDRGYIIFEERISGEQSELSTLKIINTIMQVMSDRGFKNPKEHIFVYTWMHYDLPDMYGSKQFTMIAIKPKAFNGNDWYAVKNWSYYVQKNNIYMKHSIEPIYPDNINKTDYRNAIHSLIQKFPDKEASSRKSDLSIITDDKPFPWSVYQDNTALRDILYKIGMFCLAVFIIILLYWKITQKMVFTSNITAFILFFAVIGLGYFIIEIGLINFYQLYTGSPAYTLIFILASLLFSSGIGSYFSGRFGRKAIIFSFIGILILCVYHLFINKYLIARIGSGPISNSAVIAVTIFPLGFFMGIPFPFGVEMVKCKMSESHIPLFFAVNCIFSTFAVVLSFYLSVFWGIKNTFFIGIGCYFIPMILALYTRK